MGRLGIAVYLEMHAKADYASGVARVDVFCLDRPDALRSGGLLPLTTTATNGNEAHDACTNAEHGEGGGLGDGGTTSVDPRAFCCVTGCWEVCVVCPRLMMIAVPVICVDCIPSGGDVLIGTVGC